MAEKLTPACPEAGCPHRQADHDRRAGCRGTKQRVDGKMAACSCNRAFG